MTDPTETKSSAAVDSEHGATQERMKSAGTVLPRLWPALVGEYVGTFILVFFGVGVINAAVVTGAQVGLWQVAVVWAFGVSLAIYAVGALSGAHINPAITLASGLYNRFPWRRVAPYWAAQTMGAASASLVLYGMFAEAIIEFERKNGLLRGGPGSELSAMVFGEYFPNPALYGTSEAAWRIVSPTTAFMAEMVGTAMLAFVVAAVTNLRNPARPSPAAAAVIIGVGVAAIISVIAPLTQAALNPARDFGPRAVSYFLGWGEIAIPGPRGGWLTVYILGPLAGGVVGGGIYRVLGSLLPRSGND